MKNILLLFVLFLNAAVFAQNGPLSDEKRKEFDAQKVAFFTQQLELTPKEAAVFWPLYNEMGRKIRAMERERRREMCRENKNDTEEQMKASVLKTLELEQKMLDTKKEYFQKFMIVVPARKISKIDWIEHKFHKQLFNKLGRQSDSRK